MGCNRLVGTSIVSSKIDLQARKQLENCHTVKVNMQVGSELMWKVMQCDGSVKMVSQGKNIGWCGMEWQRRAAPENHML